jgi:hypothetical protein
MPSRPLTSFHILTDSAALGSPRRVGVTQVSFQLLAPPAAPAGPVSPTAGGVLFHWRLRQRPSQVCDGSICSDTFRSRSDSPNEDRAERN